MNNMRKFESYSKFLTWFVALMLSALVTGCGGGGGFSTSDVAPAATATTVSGVAASGAPIAGATVQMVCAGGTPGTAVLTGADGGFTVTAPLTAPCVIKVSGATGAIGGPLFSIVTSSSQTRANVNQLTHMLAFLLAGGDPDNGLFQSPGSISSKITATAVATHKATITASVIANLGAAAGIPTSFDFLEGIFTANHTGFDLVLDKIGFTATGNTVSTVFNGAPLLAVNATTGVASTTSSAVISSNTLAAASTFGAPDTAKAVTALSFAGLPGVAATIDEATKTIVVTVPSGTNVKALVANFAITGANVKVGAAPQTSGVTANDFTNPVAFTVTDAKGVTATYTVTVTVASATAKATTAFSFAGITGAAGTIDEAAKTIAVTVPNGTNVKALVATFATTGATVKVGTTVQTSGVTANDFTNPVAFTVTDANGVTATYTVNVTVASASAKAGTAFSFTGIPGAAGTINEAAKTVVVTVPFGTDVKTLAATFATTGTVVKVGTTVQTSGVTANDFTSPVAFTVAAADGTTATYTVTVAVAPSSAKALTAYSIAGFPAVAGTINEAAKTVAVTMPFGTDLTALVAAFTTTGASVKVGAAVQTSTATANNFTSPVAYIVTAADGTTATYTVTVTVAPNSAKAITAYSFAGFTGATGTISEAAKTIAVTVPFGTPVTALVATFTTTGAGVKVGAAVQTSVATPNDFTSPVSYVVTAADGTTATYAVTVTVALNSAKTITAYSFAGFTDSVGVISESVTPRTIAVSVPPGTNLTALVATFTTTGTGVKVGTAVQTSAASANDFSTSPVAYIVTAADGTTATYNVTVSLGKGPAPVLLGAAGSFAILTKAGITDVPSSAINGNIGSSPITGASIGVTCAEMATGKIYEVDAAYVGNGVVTCAKPGTTGGTPNADKTFVDNAVGDMAIGYTDAAGRAAGVGTNLNIGAGTVATQTLVPGIYTWSSNVTITGDLTLSGGPNDVWIFQVTGTFNLSPNVKILLAGGALAKNIFWQATGAVTLGTTSHFEGIILAKTNIALNTGASVNGRLFAQTAATLQSNAVTQPAP